MQRMRVIGAAAAAGMVLGGAASAGYGQATGNPFCKVRELGSIDFNAGFEIDVDGSIAYCRGLDLLYAVDVSDPAEPQILSATPVSGLYDVRAVGSLVYTLRLFGASLDIYDASDPTGLVLLSSLPIAGPEIIEVVGTVAYITNRSQSTLSTVDVSDPANPRLLDSIAISDGITRLFVRWPTVYLSSLSELVTIDASDPENLRELDRFGQDAIVQAVSGSLAYLRDRPGGRRTYSLVHVGRPDAVRLFTRGDFDVQAYGAPWQISGDALYTDGSRGGTLAIHDLRDPARPRTLGEFAVRGSRLSFEVVDQRLYALTDQGLAIYDVGGCPAYPFCPVDFDADGTADYFDAQAFLNLYARGDLKADFNADGAVTAADFAAFESAFAAGCP